MPGDNGSREADGRILAGPFSVFPFSSHVPIFTFTLPSPLIFST